MLASRILLLLVTVGCNAYDPDLGAEPFFCGDSDPRCPDGYICVERVGSDRICQRSDIVGDAGNDGNLLCSADAQYEPNESIEAPTLLPIPEAGETHMLTAVICPAADLDTYRLNVDATGKNIRLEVTYESAGGMLAAELLNSVGVSIRMATPHNNDPDTLRADFDNLAQGTYFARVKGTGMLNNYSAKFIISAGALPP